MEIPGSDDKQRQCALFSPIAAANPRISGNGGAIPVPGTFAVPA
jgi:hypothetical protein